MMMKHVDWFIKWISFWFKFNGAQTEVSAKTRNEQRRLHKTTSLDLMVTDSFSSMLISARDQTLIHNLDTKNIPEYPYS